MTRVEATTGRVLARVRVGHRPRALAVGEGSVWVASSHGTRPHDSLERIDAGANRSVSMLRLPGAASDVSVAHGAVWIVGPSWSFDGTIARVDPATNVLTTTRARGTLASLAAGRDAVWVADPGSASVLRVDFVTLATRRIGLPRARVLAPPLTGTFRTASGDGAEGVSRGRAALVVLIATLVSAAVLVGRRLRGRRLRGPARTAARSRARRV